MGESDEYCATLDALRGFNQGDGVLGSGESGENFGDPGGGALSSGLGGLAARPDDATYGERSSAPGERGMGRGEVNRYADAGGEGDLAGMLGLARGCDSRAVV